MVAHALVRLDEIKVSSFFSFAALDTHLTLTRLQNQAKYKAESKGNQSALTRAMSYRLASNTPRYLAQLAVIPATGWTRAHIHAPGMPPAPRALATTAGV